MRAFVTLLVSAVIAKALVFVWNNSMSPDEWRLIVKGAPDLPKRADLLITEEEVAE